METISKLEKLAIVSKLCTELENHIGISEKTLAEFILDLYARADGNLQQFKRLLDENEADFPEIFIENLHRIITTMRSSSSGSAGDGVDSNTGNVKSNGNDESKFTALSMPNNPEFAQQLIEEASSMAKRKRSPPPADHKERTSYRNIELDDEPIVDKVYDGVVKNLKDFGAFISLQGIRNCRDGMVHISHIQTGQRLSHPDEVLSKGQKVKVKVIKYDGNRISLSMKDIDQETGRDFNQRRQRPVHNDSVPVKTSIHAEQDSAAVSRQNRKRLASPDLWEIKQLIASGVLDPSEYPHLDPEHGLMDSNLEPEEELEIELKEEEPTFLKGQTARTLNLSPVKVIKVPDGSMNRAAIAGAALAKERKEIKRQLRDDLEAETKSKTKSRGSLEWEDPMAAADASSTSKSTQELIESTKVASEWRKQLAKDQSFGKRTSLSIQEQRESLPIFKLRRDLLNAIHENQILVVIGDTGSGKTTQMTQYLAEEGYTTKGLVGCTQPRRVAAMSVAKRVAEEVGCRVGQEVGYTIRFEDCTSSQTKIKYMTDGMMLREALIDRNLKKYSVIILDEAHERTIHTDVLFGLLKDVLKRRSDLKLIVTSATLDAEKFSNYFYNCPIFTIPGRTFPVEILFANQPETDYLDACLVTIMQIHLNDPPGDILVFLTGQEEIDTACEILFSRMKALGSLAPELIILPVYSALPSEVQSRIFEPAPEGARKCVIATNIAETSITIDGIYYVVDPGFVKQNCYDPKLGMDSLVIVPISQAQARQRSGRAGRTGPGKCYRLYTEAAFQFEMLPNGLPEIQRTNLSNTVLTLKAMGINDLLHFDFMDKPPHQTLITALENLYALGALDEEGFLTRIGRKMAEFPLEPQLSKMLIASVDMGCSEEILTIVAMLSVQNVFFRPKEKQEIADQRKSRFNQPEGDHLTLLTVYNSWRNENYSSTWCFESYVQYRSLKRAADVRKQILGIMERYNIELVSCGRNYNMVRKAITAGYFMNAARKDPTEGYKTILENTTVFIHPSSALFNRNPDWVIYHELVMTSREYMREITAIDPKWLMEVAPTFFKVIDPRMSKRRKAQKIEPLFNRFEEKDEWRISKVR